jgi:hypothetical protein
MARLEKRVLGEIRGRIGDVVVKVRNGKQYIASRPSKYTISKAPHEVDKRNRFKVNGLFAKAINENKLLYSIWDNEKAPAASAYNKICKINFKLCNTSRPSVQNLITPRGFNLPVESFSYFPNRVETKLNPFDILPGEKSVIFILLICFYEPVMNEADYFTIKRIEDYDMDELKLTFNFNPTEKQIALAYKNRIAYLAAVTRDGTGNILRWSETVSREL